MLLRPILFCGTIAGVAGTDDGRLVTQGGEQ